MLAISWVALLGGLACDRKPAPAPAAASPRQTSCAGLGPASCERPPNGAAGLCAQLAGCVKDPTGNIDLDGLTMDCKREPPGAAPEKAFIASQPAPARSGVRSTSILEVVASENETLRFAAAYLVAELAEGRCVIDGVLPWGSSFADTELAMRWEPASGGLPRLEVRAHRTTYTVLDQEELARGESSVTSQICAQRSYDVADGRFTLVSHAERDGDCAPLP
jgi:hypothetical protein